MEHVGLGIALSGQLIRNKLKSKEKKRLGKWKEIRLGVLIEARLLKKKKSSAADFELYTVRNGKLKILKK